MIEWLIQNLNFGRRLANLHQRPSEELKLDSFLLFLLFTFEGEGGFNFLNLEELLPVQTAGGILGKHLSNEDLKLF